MCQFCVSVTTALLFSHGKAVGKASLSERKSADCLFPDWYSPNRLKKINGGWEERVLMGEEGEISSADSLSLVLSYVIIYRLTARDVYF